MDKTQLQQIKEYFTLLKQGHLYMKDHPDNVEKNQGLIERAKDKFVPPLEELGVHETFTMALLIFGGVVEWPLVSQFKK